MDLPQGPTIQAYLNSINVRNLCSTLNEMSKQMLTYYVGMRTYVYLADNGILRYMWNLSANNNWAAFVHDRLSQKTSGKVGCTSHSEQMVDLSAVTNPIFCCFDFRSESSYIDQSYITYDRAFEKRSRPRADSRLTSACTSFHSLKQRLTRVVISES